MEGQSSSYGNPQQLVSLSVGSYGHHVDDPYLHFLTISDTMPIDHLPLPPWIHSQKPSPNYVEFLAENSAFLEEASPADMLKCIASPVGSSFTMDGVGVPAEIQREFSFGDPGKACVCDLSQDANAWNVKPSVYVLNNVNDHEPTVNLLNARSEGESVNKYTSQEYQSYVESLSNNTIWQPRQSKSAVAHDFLPRPKTNTLARQKAANTDRCRRERVAQRMKALQELLPHTAEVNQASVLDEIIDLVKYLQLQIKELSRSRLGGEPSITPFIFLEGFGHYIHHEQMMNEPLEEMIGNLLESDPSGATRLLENKGLYMMPAALVEVLHKAI